MQAKEVENVTVEELAAKLELPSDRLIKVLASLGEWKEPQSELSTEEAELICDDLGFRFGERLTFDREQEVRRGLKSGSLYSVTVDEAGASRTFNAFRHEKDSMFCLHDRTWEETSTVEFRLTLDADIMLEAMREVAPLEEWEETGG